jgi:hypothetical protein
LLGEGCRTRSLSRSGGEGGWSRGAGSLGAGGGRGVKGGGARSRRRSRPALRRCSSHGCPCVCRRWPRWPAGRKGRRAGYSSRTSRGRALGATLALWAGAGCGGLLAFIRGKSFFGEQRGGAYRARRGDGESATPRGRDWTRFPRDPCFKFGGYDALPDLI